jgi:hypothetical protein
MEPAAEFRVTPAEGERPGAFVAFPYDRELVQRFRETFPRARWRGDEACWFVPGPTAPARLDAWLSRELAALDRHADAKGRDAYSFDPLQSRYLVVGEDLGIRTPYSRTVVEIMRTIPWARWDPEDRIWRVPFRSYEALRACWPAVEEAALRNEPEARRKRREEQKGQPRDPEAIALEAERRRKRYPVPGDDLPPLEEPVTVFAFGVVVFENLGDELIGRGAVPVAYPHVSEETPSYIWARWRLPTFREIAAVRPRREAEGWSMRAARGWWRPDRGELDERRRILRRTERAKQAHEGAES